VAKRDPHHPALRGYQVWRWIKKGILEAEPLRETPILVVQKRTRVRLTPKYRTTISQGIFLVPRWIPAPKYEWEKFSRLSTKELEAKGIIKRRGVLYLLIYQQVEDISHLYRQQEHILAKRESAFESAKGRRGRYILFDGVPTQVFDLKIKPFIVKRKEAAAGLEKRRAKQLQRIRVLRLVPLLGRLGIPEMPIPDRELEGIVRYLDDVIDELEEIIERPLVTRRKRAQRSLRSAQRWIKERKFYLARKRLLKALQNLAWPK